MGESAENAIEAAEDDSWVFESLVNFIHGPIWNLPVIGFIEEKCVVFDPDSYKNMTEDKEEEYRKIHEEFKGLVDFMLANFMEDIQVTPEQVEAACRIRETNAPMAQSQVTKVALEQLCAAEDFTTFRRLLTRKNIDLQLQALEMLVAKYGVLSPSLKNMDSQSEGTTDEDEFLKVVIRYTGMYNVLNDEMNAAVNARASRVTGKASACTSLAEEPKDRTMHDSVDTNSDSADFILLSTHIKNPEPVHSQPKLPEQRARARTPAHRDRMTVTDHNSLTPLNCPSRKAIDHDPDQSKPRHTDDRELEEARAAPVASKKEAKNTKKALKPVKSSIPTTISTSASVEIKSVAPEHERLLQVKQALELPAEDFASLITADSAATAGIAGMALSGSEAEGASEEDIQKRREYMRNQRDKLVELKRKERERQLNADSFGAGEHAKNRPKSSKAARTAYANLQNPLPANERSVAARRALANRLKQALSKN